MESHKAKAMRILLIDDDDDIRKSVGDYLNARDYTTTRVNSGEAGLRVLQSDPIDIVITDIMMSGMDGFEVLRQVRTVSPETEVIMVTGFGDIDQAVKAMRDGAFDFFTKPIKMRELSASIERTVKFHALRQDRDRVRSRLDRIEEAGKRSFGVDAIVGESAKLQKVREQVLQVAQAGSTSVLVTGETGTGKEVVARAIHYESDRASGPYVPVDCSAIPKDLMESEFFGHEKGSFTGATGQRRGHFELADEGTVLLDEIGDMDIDMQAKLLRVLEGRTLKRVGGEKDIPVDVRVISATNRNLAGWIREGRFREDLYYRINPFTIEIPPLRERAEDIPSLADHLLKMCAGEMRKDVMEFAGEAMDALRSHAWPGNVRELRNTVERAVIVCDGPSIEPSDLEFVLSIRAIAEEQPLSSDEAISTDADAVMGHVKDLRLDSVERATIEEAIRRAGGNRGRAADLLGLSRFALRRRLQQYGLE